MVELQNLYLAKAKTWQKFFEHSTDSYLKDYGAPWYLAHRADLHELLRTHATREDRPGRPATIIKSSLVKQYVRKDFDTAQGRIFLNDGSTHQADVVIAADGVHSLAVEHVIGHKNPATPQGLSLFRFLIPTSAILEDPQTSHLVDEEAGKLKLFTTSRPACRLIWYPCRANEVQNLGGMFPDDPEKPKYGAVEDWNVTTSRDKFFEEFKDELHPDLLRLCEKAPEFKLWKVMSRNPLPTWFNERLVVVGDAAHPMLPRTWIEALFLDASPNRRLTSETDQAQGGAQAIEDGAALGVLFSELTTKDRATIEERLQLFQDVRIGRASTVQVMSNQAAELEQDEAARQAALKYIPEGLRAPSKTD
ncbi:MAG: hypothetical protein Q9159_003882 [Coniocarpon cinnabarinum]